MAIELQRIPVDFNTEMAYPVGLVHIPTHMYPELLDVIRDGQTVILYEEGDMEVEAVLEHDAASNTWYGRPDWRTLHHLDEHN